MYRELAITPEKKVLIISPHPDDETIGAGGVLALYGPQCDVVLLTDGRFGNPDVKKYSEDEIVEIRHNEFIKVMDYFHVNHYECLMINDTTVNKNKKALHSIDYSKYDYVFIPNHKERHVDHYAAYKTINRLMKMKRLQARIMEYEVWSPLSNPNYFINLSNTINSKLEAISFYESQLSCMNYHQMIIGLNSYRGIHKKMDYCEAYYSRHMHFKEELDKICGLILNKHK